MKRTGSISRLLTAIIVLLAACQVASARQLTVDEAISKAIKDSGIPALRGSRSSGGMQLVHTERQDDLNTLYVLNRDNGGYMILSADNVGAPVLAYSEDGTYDPADVPPAMAYMLEEYSTHIAAASRSGAAEYTAPSRISIPAIAPLLTCKWDQGAPYNAKCPFDSYTGCTVTAAAQVMYHHKWPERANGRIRYTWNGKQYTFNGDTTPFDWDNMLDTYQSDYTEEQKTAVANLMYAQGISSKAQWSNYATGASIEQMSLGLLNNFFYDSSLQIVRPQYFTQDEWIELLCNEFKNNRPVILSGGSTSAGHTFVGDGYDGDGRVHINWGWSGSSDGYFSCEALSPVNQGIGGGGHEYSSALRAVIGIRPEVKGSVPNPIFGLNGSFGPAEQVYGREGEINMLSSEGKFVAQSVSPIKYTPGFRLVSETDEVSYIWSTLTLLQSSNGEYTTNNWGQGPESLPCKASDFPQSGTYVLTPVVKYNDVIKDVKVTLGNVGTLKLEASDNQLRFTPLTEMHGVTVDEITCYGDFYESAQSHYKVTLTNNGAEYYGSIQPLLDDADGKKAGQATTSMIRLLPGETKSLEWKATFSYNVPAGDYTLYFIDNKGNRLSGLTKKITILEPVTPEVTLNTLTIPKTLGETTVGNNTATNVSKTTEIDMTLTSPNYNGELSVTAYVYRHNDYKDNGTAGSASFIAKAGEAVPAKMTVTIPDKFEEGTILHMYLYYGSVQLSNPYYLYVTSKSGITGIVDDADADAPVEYFNLQGIRVDTPTAPGLYLRRQGKKVEKIYLR